MLFLVTDLAVIVWNAQTVAMILVLVVLVHMAVETLHIVVARLTEADLLIVGMGETTQQFEDLHITLALIVVVSQDVVTRTLAIIVVVHLHMLPVQPRGRSADDIIRWTILLVFVSPNQRQGGLTLLCASMDESMDLQSQVMNLCSKSVTDLHQKLQQSLQKF